MQIGPTKCKKNGHAFLWTIAKSGSKLILLAKGMMGGRLGIIPTLEPISIFYNTDNQLKYEIPPVV